MTATVTNRAQKDQERSSSENGRKHFHQTLPHLNEDGEEDDGDDGGEEHLPLGKVLLLQQEAQREGDGAAQAAVRNDELVFGGQLDNAELVDKEGQTDNTWGQKKTGRTFTGLAA